MLVSEFGRGGSPNRSLQDNSGFHRPETCEGQFFRAMDILVPILECEGIKPPLEALPRTGSKKPAPQQDIIKTINSAMERASFIAPHSFFYGPDMEASLRSAGYDGPVSFEPFAEEVHALAEPEAALRDSIGFMTVGVKETGSVD